MGNIIKQTLQFVSAQDRLELSGLLVMPEGPAAVLQISHGMCEHKERYVPFMEYMAERGYACVIHDHRGHGGSVRSPKDLGYFYQNGGEALVEDLYQVTVEMKKKFQGLPYFLFGHSMGSLAVRCYIKKYDEAVDGLVVCGSPGNNAMAGAGILLNRLLQIFRGGHSRSSFFDKMILNGFEKAFVQENTIHAWICSDKEVVGKYNDDPFCNFSFTLNGYEALLWLVKNTYSPKGWKVSNPELPVRFISGREDPCMINEKEFEKAVAAIRNVGYQRVDSHLYEGMRHEILNETGRIQVYADIAGFYDGIRNTAKEIQKR